MENIINKDSSWIICQECHGQGKKQRRFKKKERRRFQVELELNEKTNGEDTTPLYTNRHLYLCLICGGSGLIHAPSPPIADHENFPHIAIIGAGIGGVALAVACLHRKIPFTLFERDKSFDARSQGYGLTLQQASKAIEALGIFSLKEGINSTRHVVHTTDGKVIGEWGMRRSMILNANKKTNPKRTNIHIARQSLRLALLEQLGGHDAVKWGYQLVDLKDNEGEAVALSFLVNGESRSVKADLVVGADGIRSSVRKLLIGDDITPFQYLGCIVILGICSLDALNGVDSSLLDSATVFQTANGVERIYMMPYTLNSIMWQFSFPMLEEDAKTLSAKGAKALKKEACRRAQWHSPIPQILSATMEAQVSGYPVYDRKLLDPELLEQWGKVTLIGDAAHPMSPFKGQGANQALLDALALARGITSGCRPLSQWREAGIRKSVLLDFESEMLARSAKKVNDSASAANYLHSEIVLEEGDRPRGRRSKQIAVDKSVDNMDSSI